MEVGSSLVAQTVKRLPIMQETWVGSLGQEDPLERKWQPTLVLLPWKFHERRNLVGHSPWGRKELDTTEQLHWYVELETYSLSISFEFSIIGKNFVAFAIWLVWAEKQKWTLSTTKVKSNSRCEILSPTCLPGPGLLRKVYVLLGYLAFVEINKARCTEFCRCKSLHAVL